MASTHGPTNRRASTVEGVAVSVQDLVKVYGAVRALRGISFTVDRGEMVAILGPNGAGKTTTLEIIEGLRQADSGQVSVLGKSPLQARIQMGIQLQEGALYDELTCAETLEHFASLYGYRCDARGLLRLVSLEEAVEQRTNRLSGGQKRRLQLALALCNNPQLIILDEPTTGLDPVNRRQCWDLIRSFHQDGRTILLTTHYIEEAEILADRVLIVDQGTIISEGSPRQLIDGLGAAVTIEIPVGAKAELSGIRAVTRVEVRGGFWHIASSDPGVTLTDLGAALGADGLRGITMRSPSLEDVFLARTGHTLEDDTGP